jgi:hypothetical protein
MRPGDASQPLGEILIGCLGRKPERDFAVPEADRDGRPVPAAIIPRATGHRFPLDKLQVLPAQQSSCQQRLETALRRMPPREAVAGGNRACAGRQFLHGAGGLAGIFCRPLQPPSRRTVRLVEADEVARRLHHPASQLDRLEQLGVRAEPQQIRRRLIDRFDGDLDAGPTVAPGALGG